MHWVVVATVAVLAACSSEPRVSPAPSTNHTTGEPPALQREDASARYLLRFSGAPVGLTEVSLRRRAGGYRFRRRDRLSVLRDGARVDSTNTITIETDSRLRAKSVRVVSRVGALVRVSRAERDHGGWRVRTAGGATSRRPSLEIAELVLAGAVSADRAAHPMLLAGADFAAVELRERSSEDGRRVIDIGRSSLGSTQLVMTTSNDGLPLSWASDTGETATRITGVPPTVDPPELLDLAALPGRGRRSRTLWVRDVRREPPPSVAGQSVEVHGDSWKIDFARPRASVPTELAELVAAVSDILEDDLTLPGLSAADALRMGRGDCSGHAAAFADLARRRGYETRLATGYRRRGRQWLRHRWVVARVDGEWVSLDPSFGEAVPSPGRLILLAMHDERAVALADLVSFAGMDSATVSFASR